MKNDILKSLIHKYSKKSEFKLESYLFDKQLSFVNDKCLNTIAVCSRRAGKSTSVAASLVLTAYTFDDCTALYVTGSRSDAKKIIWREILKFNRMHNLHGIPNISELTLSFRNGSVVRLHGARDEGEIDKIRGQLPPIKKVFIDEAQKIRDHILVTLIDDVLEPALLDYGASISLLGTPGSVPAGYFYRCSHNLKEDGSQMENAIWSVHHWTFFDNPHIALKSGQTHQELLDRVLKRRALVVSDPTIQREYFGKWTLDSDSLLIRYNEKINHFETIPTFKTAWNYILGIDLGFDDADALCVLAWHDDTPITYLVEEVITHGQGISELVEQVQKLDETYHFDKMVVDQGGLGKKIAEEMRRRHKIPVIAAEKNRKFEHITFLNDALRTGNFMAKRNSRFAQDSYMVEVDHEKTTPDKIVVKQNFHSDIIDSVIYAYVASPSFGYEKPIKKPKVGTKEWFASEEKDMFDQNLEKLKHQQALEKDDWENYLSG